MCTAFSNQAAVQALASSVLLSHTAEDIPVCFRPSFVISKNVASVIKILKQVQDDVASDMSFDIPEKEITDCGG